MTTHRLWPEPRERASDGVARHGDASHPQAWGRQERRGREEESAHGVQVGITPLLTVTGRMKQRLFLMVTSEARGCLW